MATDWIGLFPIITLSGGGVIIFLVGAFWRSRPRDLLFALALATALAAGVVTFLLPAANPSFRGLLDLGDYGRFFIFLLLFITIVTLLFLRQYSRTHGFSGDELYALLIFSALGMIFTAIATNWAIFFLGLELLSLALYVLIAIRKGEPYGNEAALKYFIMGAVASAFLTFGLGLLYAMTGDLQIAGSLAAARTYPDHLPVILIGLAFLLVGIGFKISIVPFHLWTPDVYEGSPAPITAFLSTGSKVALFAALLRFCLLLAPSVWAYAWPFLWALAALTMAVGNLTALYQTHAKRLLAYSSIAQMGYLLMTLVAVKQGSLPAIMFYLAVYAIMDLGAFGIIGTFSKAPTFGIEGTLSKTPTDLEKLTDYQGLGYSHPWRAAILATCLISLTGLPPTAGFIGKLVLFRAVLHANFITLAVIGMLTVILSIYYYINFVVHLYMHERHHRGRLPSPDVAIGLACAVILLGILWLGVIPESLLHVISGIYTSLPKPI
jgi:NADH-quinone oxidoreductase subunit N